MYNQLEKNNPQVLKTPKPNSQLLSNPTQFQAVSQIVGGNALALHMMNEGSKDISNSTPETKIQRKWHEQPTHEIEVVQLFTANQIMGDVIATAGSEAVTYGAINKEILRKDGDPDVTFGVELEVVHEDVSLAKLNEILETEATEKTPEGESVISDIEEGTGAALRNASVKKAEEVGLTDEKWSSVIDASIQGGAGIEWISGVFHIAPEYWESIEQMCKIINDYNGVINNTCSEHIHVGHSVLEGHKEKFDGLFKLYCAFQDVVDVFARCSDPGLEIRAGADNHEGQDGYAKKMNVSTGTNHFFNIMNAKSIRTKIAFASSAERAPYISAWNNITNVFDKPITSPAMDVILTNINSVVYDKIGLMVKELFGLELNNFESKEKLYDNIQALGKKTSAARSFYEIFQLNPLSNQARTQAINITQNYDSNKLDGRTIPTVEFRRFNGVKDANIVQANVLLTTLMMNAAAKDNPDTPVLPSGPPRNISQLITQSNGVALKGKAELLIDFLTDHDGTKGILVHAYLANAKINER